MSKENTHKANWIEMPRGKSSITKKHDIVIQNFRLMGREVIPEWNYNGKENELVLFTVDKGKYAHTVLQQRYKAARTAYRSNTNYNEFHLESVHCKTSYIRKSFLDAKPRRMILETWRFKDAVEPIPFWFDPSDTKNLELCRHNLKLFAAEGIIFMQPWGEFNKSTEEPTQEVWINSLENKEEAIRFAWQNSKQPGRLIDKGWHYQDTTTPISFTLIVSEDHDFSDIIFKQSLNKWSQDYGINLKSTHNKNQAIQILLNRIGCKLQDPSFDYEAIDAPAEKKFRQKIKIIDEFGVDYETTLECLSKGMNQNSIGAGQLPWRRGSSRLTPGKIRKDPRLRGQKAILYVASIQDSLKMTYIKIGITTKNSPEQRCKLYKTIAKTKHENLLSIAVLESALLRATASRAPENHEELRFPQGFGGGNSEIRDQSVLRDFDFRNPNLDANLHKCIETAKLYEEEKKLYPNAIKRIISHLKSE